MQKISSPFNRLYHALLNEAFNKARQISFRQWKDTSTGGCLIFYKGEDYTDMDDLKQIFKLMNIDYPLTEDGKEKVSTRDITNKELCRHIIWVTRLLNQNAITFNHDDLEWERILLSAGIEKE